MSKPEPNTKRGNTMTLMDRRKTFGKRVVRNNVEIINQLPDYEQTLNDDYPPSFNDMGGYKKMNYH
jgi:hypothetical protein